MTFDQWWFDYRIKNGISTGPSVKQNIARDAWAAAQAQEVAAICQLDGCLALRSDAASNVNDKGQS